jgi:hypothetical protein
MIKYEDLIEVMEQIREYEFTKSKQVASFIELVKENFGDERTGS